MPVSYVRSGQITVVTAGTAVQGPDVPGSRFMFRAMPGNTDAAYIGNSAGDVDSGNGYPLFFSAADRVILDIPNLQLIWFDTAVSGEKIAWIRVR